MTDLQIQLTLNQAPEAVFTALTTGEGLVGWLAEAAEVNLAEQWLTFWGRFSPETPTQTMGRHRILRLEANKRLDFEWVISGAKTAVSLTLIPQSNTTVLKLIHHELFDKKHGIEVPMEDFWLLSLENLRRYLDGRSITRFDFSAITRGDIVITVPIEATPQTVFDVLTNPAELRRWIAYEAEVELREGGRFDIGWGHGGPVKILELMPNEKIVYSWSAWERDPETVTAWSLAESGGKTHLTLVHSGFTDERNNEDLQAGWLNFMGWVRSIAEYGANWQPPIKKLTPELYKYYPASMGAAQESLV
ncbi:MAG: SRPBCC domain-containing protein [Chloroflexota bacterium]